MSLMEWLDRNDVRLDIVVGAVFDPIKGKIPRWRCEIRGFPDTDAPRSRPAVFLLDAKGGVADVVAYGDSPDEALRGAMNLLCGRNVSVILRERDDVLKFPEHLTV